MSAGLLVEYDPTSNLQETLKQNNVNWSRLVKQVSVVVRLCPSLYGEQCFKNRFGFLPPIGFLFNYKFHKLLIGQKLKPGYKPNIIECLYWDIRSYRILFSHVWSFLGYKFHILVYIKLMWMIIAFTENLHDVN